MAGRLDSRTALVTGASSGIGGAVALDLDVTVEPSRRDARPAAERSGTARADRIRRLRREDIGAAVVHAVTAPAHGSVDEVLVRPTEQVW